MEFWQKIIIQEVLEKQKFLSLGDYKCLKEF